jgi:hypothetical protein
VARLHFSPIIPAKCPKRETCQDSGLRRDHAETIPIKPYLLRFDLKPTLLDLRTQQAPIRS